MMVVEERTVREGYKMTELGEIPVEWNVATLGEVLKVGYGKNQKNVEVEKSDIPILGTGGIIGWAKTPLFEKPSVLIGRKGTIDKPQYMEKPFWTIDTLFYTDINIEKTVPKFIYYLFQTVNWYKYNEATGVPSLSATNISKIRHSFPPLKEQQKIAEILSAVDEQIENTDQLIEKTKELKKGLMQQLLTKGIGHAEFKKTELGEIPVEWKTMKLNQVTQYVDYRGKTPPKQDSGIQLITAKNIKQGYIDYESSKEYINEDDYDSVMRRGKPCKGDVLFTTEAPLGNVAQVDNESIALAQRVIKFNGINLLDNTFLKFYMLSQKFQYLLFSKATGSTVKGIQGKQLHNLLIAIPSLEEQQKIAEILSAVDEQIESYEQEKEKYTELKKGLMQQLLTGKLRVTV